MGDRPARPFGLVLEALSRRRSFRAGLLLLALVVSSAVYAPLIANDRPFFLLAADRGAVDAARRTLGPITRAILRLAPRAAAEPHAREELDREGAAARLRLATVRRYAAGVPALEAYGDALERTLRTARDGTDPAPAAALLEHAALEIERALGDPGLALVARASSPLARALGPPDVLAILGWTGLLLALFLGRRRARSGTWAPGWRAAALVLGIALVAAVLWKPLLGGASLAGAGLKADLDAGRVEARLAIFPPIAMGFAETHLAEAFRPPTWTRASRLDAEGRYLDASQASRAAAATPVVPRRAEPALNAPLRHPLGTDGAGRDLLARLLWGGRASLAVGFLSAVLLTAIGTAVGALAGALGGRWDLALSRAIEIVISFPAFFLVLMVMAFTDPRVVPPVAGIVLVIALVNWTSVARLARAEVLRLREAEFVLAARAAGFSTTRVVLVHMLPNALGPILVAFAFAVAGGILVESTISYLGFGVDRPTPSWGSLAAESQSPDHWWVQLFPGLAIVVTLVATHLVGESLRDALDPRGPARARAMEATA